MTPTGVDRILDRARRGTVGLALALGGALGAVYPIVALARMRYPYELEWMEGGMVDHVRRVLDGLPIYAKPSIDFVSFLYPPLYYWAAAAMSLAIGPGFVALRLLSFLSSLGVFALLYAIVRRESGSPAAGALAAMMFAATYDRAGGWFDLARLDSFYMLLLLAAVAIAARAASAGGAVVAGLVVAAAFLTKQSALLVAAALVVAASLSSWRKAAWLGGTAALAMAAAVALLDAATDGWFRYYAFTLPAHHPRVPDGLVDFWTRDLLPALPIAMALAAGHVASLVRGPGGRSRFALPVVVAGTLAGSWSVRNMVGAEVNNLLPAFAGVSILGALGVATAARRAESAGTTGARVVALIAAAAAVAQLGWLAYDPRPHLPSGADRTAGDRVVARLRAIDGDVFVPHHGYLARMAGKRGFAHTLAMDNVYLDDFGPARRDLEAEMRRALSERRFAAVLLESDGRYGVAILQSYDAREALFDSPDVFWPVTGGRLRPEALCLPR